MPIAQESELTEEILARTEGGEGPVLVDEIEEDVLTVYLKTGARSFVGKFFYEMLTKWLFPGKRVNMPLFVLTEVGGLCLAKVIIREQGASDHFELLKHEICLGLRSPYHAAKILEMKGLSSREKTILVQERLSDYLHRFPHHFDYDLLTLMQRIFSSAAESFIAPRSSHYLARILTTIYGLHRKLEGWMDENPGERNLYLKCFDVTIELPLERKRVFGLSIALNFIHEHEVCGLRHLKEALRSLCPQVEEISGSGIEHREGRRQTIYLEVEANQEDRKTIKHELLSHLLARIERLQKPLFAPRNEEEVLRNLIALIRQLKYVKDYPQVMISFDEQGDRELAFTVLIARVLKENTPPIRMVLEGTPFSLDRVKEMGAVRKRYPKEGAILRAYLPIASFIRSDQSVDLVKARAHVLAALQQCFGEVRDYNGGTIAKSREAYEALKGALGPIAKKHSLLLDNLFHSTSPAFMRSIVHPEVFKTLLQMFTRQRRGPVTCREQEGLIYLIVDCNGHRQEVLDSVTKLQIPTAELLTCALPHALGFVSLSCDKRLPKAVQSVMLKQ